MLLAVPLLLQRFLSDREAYWGTEFHYSGILAPILFMAAVDGFGRARTFYQRRSGRRGRPLVMSGTLLAAYSVLFMAFGMLHFPALYPFQRLVTGNAFVLDERATAIAEVLPSIPEDVCVEADEQIVPHLLSRRAIALPTWLEGEATWLVLDLSQSEPAAFLPNPRVILRTYLAKGWVVAKASGPIVALRMPDAPASGCAPRWSQDWVFPPLTSSAP